MGEVKEDGEPFLKTGKWTVYILKFPLPNKNGSILMFDPLPAP